MKDDLVFDMEMAREYDKGIRRALPTYDAMFRMVQSFLRAHVKESANVLVIGAGGGNEFVTFGTANPTWTFAGVDPSEAMLEVALQKAKNEGMEERVSIHAGKIEELELTQIFNAATCLLVLHFVETLEEKLSLLKTVKEQLQPGSPFVLVTMFGDQSKPEFNECMNLWKSIWLDLTDLTKEDVEGMEESVRELSFISAAQIEDLLAQAGFDRVTQFFSTTLFGGWIAHAEN
ncbi:class I SAM-dependent methyltransferase [Paenisporosarcina antarctica]|uniref:Class I SAM-dependent methyltransferase n=1 Tax=Paenisporosarcina antarctica TaxID=417367 RepID=A0A4P7A083_9BACL|nr:class I SAM-dependent methyltransferase [Paenisporosarcina antarctica]QBP42271.1 class I SAM-dependent methyltransferase [Paenisporosarcina antarctica]